MNDYRSRWERLELILREKLDISLPRAMRDNAIDMWIHVVKLGLPDPLHLDLGVGVALLCPDPSNGSTSYFNFDKKTGKQLSNDDLIKDKKAFLALAEKKFRELQQVPEGESINSTGYMFENDTFALPINIGFENNEMVLLYNPYEVASYADGIIEIRFAVSEVQDLLAINP